MLANASLPKFQIGLPASRFELPEGGVVPLGKIKKKTKKNQSPKDPKESEHRRAPTPKSDPDTRRDLAMAEHFPMGAYSAFPPYGFNMPMQTANGMYQMPPQTTMPMGSMTMPTPPGFGQPPQMQAVPKPKKKAKATPKKVRRAHLMSAGEREARGSSRGPRWGSSSSFSSPKPKHRVQETTERRASSSDRRLGRPLPRRTGLRPIGR